MLLLQLLQDIPSERQNLICFTPYIWASYGRVLTESFLVKFNQEARRAFTQKRYPERMEKPAHMIRHTQQVLPTSPFSEASGYFLFLSLRPLARCIKQLYSFVLVSSQVRLGYSLCAYTFSFRHFCPFVHFVLVNNYIYMFIGLLSIYYVTSNVFRCNLLLLTSKNIHRNIRRRNVKISKSVQSTPRYDMVKEKY